MAYNKKTSTSKQVRKTVEEPVNEVVEEVIEDTMQEPVEEVVQVPKKAKTEPKVEQVEYKGDDLIPCKSVTEGELICKVDKEFYHWSGYGDVTEVTYSDLMSLRAKKSAFIFEPLFIIDDEVLISQPRWKNVKDFYDSMYTVDDISEVIELPLPQFKKVFKTLPKGIMEAVVTQISTLLSNGEFDSIQKIKFVDEVYGSDLSLLL